jgi:serine/threonine protein phosphatase PrpC
VFARTDVGRVRTNNEDAFTVTDLDTGAQIESAGAATQLDVHQRGVLMVVSDGMGGHAAGEVASALVVDSLRKSLGEEGADSTSIQRLIDASVRRANFDVFRAARSARKRGMGATLTAVLVHQTDAYVASVGDSRAYLLRAGRIRQITKDQSYVQLLIDAGAMTKEQAKGSDQKNVILQAMGQEANVLVSIGRLSLRSGDRLLICSDGLTGKVEDDELAAMLVGPDLAAGCQSMIDLANQRGGEDNVTAIVALVEGEGLPQPGPRETVTHTFEVLQDFGPVKQKPGEVPAPLPDFELPMQPQAQESMRGPLLAAIAAILLLLAAIVWWLLGR